MNQSVDRPNFEESHVPQSDVMKSTIFLSRMASMIQSLAKGKDVQVQDNNNKINCQKGHDENNAIELEETPNEVVEERMEVQKQIIEPQITQPVQDTQQGQWIYEEPAQVENGQQEPQETQQERQEAEGPNDPEECVEDVKIVSKRKQQRPQNNSKPAAIKSSSKSETPQKKIISRIRNSSRSKLNQLNLRRKTISRQLKQPLPQTHSKSRPKMSQQKESKPPVKQQKQKSSIEPLTTKTAPKKKVTREEGTIIVKIQQEQPPRSFLNKLNKSKPKQKPQVINKKEKAKSTNTKAIKKPTVPVEPVSCFEEMKFKIRVPIVGMKFDKQKEKPAPTKTFKHASSSPRPLQKPAATPSTKIISSPSVQASRSIKQMFTPKMLLSKSKEMEVDIQLQERIEAKVNQPQGKINLGSFNLCQLVRQVYKNKLIQEEFYQKFTENYSDSHIQEFLQKFQAGKLRKFNFRRTQFTPLDHRRLSELLINLFPYRYYLDPSSLPVNESWQFIKSSYGLNPKEYFDIYSRIDKISDINWWIQIMVKQKAKIQQGGIKGKDCATINNIESSWQNQREQPKGFGEAPKKRVKFV